MEYKKVKFNLATKKYIFEKQKTDNLSKKYKKIKSQTFNHTIFKEMNKIKIPNLPRKKLFIYERESILLKPQLKVNLKIPKKYVLTSINHKYPRKTIRWHDSIQFKNKEDIEIIDVNNLKYKIPKIKKRKIIINMKNTEGIEDYVMRIRLFNDIIEIYSLEDWIFEYKGKRYKSINKLKRILA
ncbi:hypothetical protein DMUE_2889 [Dictyocoela muelleri]|nr:hypothetical protein DMUE_2889 [Dictyocoela muelleri]